MLYQWQGKQPTYQIPFTGWIADNATLIGDINLGNNVNIWFGSVVRADNAPISIGDNTNIQENCVIHTDEDIPLIIGKGVTIGHLVMLHGCEIDDNSLIGIGAVILNHTKIGKNCIIGARALVTEKMVIPDNSLVVGIPAKIIRTLDESSADKLRKSAQQYVEKSQSFKKDLIPIII